MSGQHQSMPSEHRSKKIGTSPDGKFLYTLKLVNTDMQVEDEYPVILDCANKHEPSTSQNHLTKYIFIILNPNLSENDSLKYSTSTGKQQNHAKKLCEINSLTGLDVAHHLSKIGGTSKKLISHVQLPHAILLIFYEKELGDSIRNLKEEIRELQQKNSALEKDLKEKVHLINEMEIQFDKGKNELLDELITIKHIHEKLRVEHEETLFDFGKLSVERAANINETKNAKLFEKIFPLKKSSGSTGVHNESDHVSTAMSSTNISGQVQHFPRDPQHFHNTESNSNPHVSSNSSPSEEASTVTEVRDHPVQLLPYVVQEEESREREPISLSNEPRSSVTADVYNAYKLLLLTISYSLLFSDIVNLKNWANEQFSVETNLSVVEIIFQLDRNGAINAMDLSSLTAFFETILRYDLVLLIEKFCSGDYVALKNMIYMTNERKRSRNRARAVDVNQVHSSRVLGSNTNVESNVNNARVLERTSTPNEHNVSANVNYNEHVRDNLSLNSKSIPNGRGNRMTASGNSDVVADGPIVNSNRGNRNNTVSYETPKTSTETSRIGKSGSSRLSSKNSDIQNHHTNCNGPSGSQPGDHFQRSKTGSDEEDKWLCNHYKRRCFVKFDCCKTFWPCHRCHNSESTCGRDKLKSRDTKMVKCVECGKEQQFGENGQFCIQCDTKFAEFYCGQCKHLTGMDDFPYHCEKCGICRIHGDRSFHCDVCGVCLDVQLRGNHKCRPDSAHDECCICLEDAFTGCQILPCSHKVHKNCATRMIQSGITRCPICRESFAHKLERRPPSKRITRKNVRHYNGNKH